MSTTDRYHRARELFDKAVALPPPSRATLLEIECQGDTALRAEVESLLANHDTATVGFLESPSAKLRAAKLGPPVEASPPTDALIGRAVGRYRIERLIATGGMGSVYEAQQEHPSRRVALKVMRAGFSAPSAMARFRLEPEFLGRLQHPNIAQVFESGVHQDDSGLVPYFAMELIDGALTLNEYVRTREPGIPDRLELFAKICDAIQHGHTKGVIHRDIKPANVLVSHSGEPKVIDFGVARATDSDITLTTQCTHVGDLIGTIRYMSPEQCDGDSHKIDTRSDVYSLGVMLYELLTGVPPYDTSSTTVYAAVRMIKEETPRRPSELNKRLRGDLDAILLKALEKDAGRRYQSAAELAADVRRHLHGDPIEARTPGVMTRAIKWAVRNPVKVSIALSVCVLLLAGAIGGTAYWIALSRPHTMLISDERDHARIVTVSGFPMHEWRFAPGGVRIAFLTKRPDIFGGGLLAFVQGDPSHGQPRFHGIPVFDSRRNFADPPDIWNLSDDEIPRDKIRARRPADGREFHAREFTGRCAILADVFPEDAESPGEELVCYIKASEVTHGAICVFSLSGAMLYRIWMDIDGVSLYWSEADSLLVVAGANGTAHAKDREVEESSQLAAPLEHTPVVFAIRPELNKLIDDYLEQEQDAVAALPPGDPRRPIWHHCVLPIGTGLWMVTPFGNGLRPARGDQDARSWLTFTVSRHTKAPLPPELSNAEFGRGWKIKIATGEFLDEHTSDSYRAYGKSADKPDAPLPSYGSWSLGPLPPIRQSSASQPAATSTAKAP